MPRSASRFLEPASWTRCVALTGILVGVADYAIGLGIFVAALGRPALGVLQAPAAGLLGQAAFRGGLQTAALGTALHFAIAIAWGAAFGVAYANSPRLRRATSERAGLLLVGAMVGSVVWIVMNNVVAPLGRGRAEPFGTAVFWAVLVGHVFFVGIPLAWGTRRFAPTDVGAGGTAHSPALV